MRYHLTRAEKKSLNLAPESTLKLLLLALGAGVVVLFPPVLYLFQIFKRARNSDEARDRQLAMCVRRFFKNCEL
jgi:hypothetical protein